MRTVPGSSPRQGKSKAALLPTTSLGREDFGSRNQPPLRELVLLQGRPQDIWRARRGESIEALAGSQTNAYGNPPGSGIAASGGRRSKNKRNEQRGSGRERSNGGRSTIGRVHHERQ